MAMRQLILLALVSLTTLCGCWAITDHHFVLWNHSDHDLRVVHKLPRDASPSGRGYETLRQEYVDKPYFWADETDTVVPANEKLEFLTFRVLDGPRLIGDSLPMKIFLGDSLIYQQDTLSRFFWEFKLSRCVAIYTATYTLHAFNSSTRQPDW